MAATLLNVDALKITRSVVIGGKERRLNSMTVEQFINSDEFNAKFNAATQAKRIGLLVEHLLGFLEDTTESELLKLEVNQLMILQFVRGSEAPEDEGKSQEATKEPSK
jgi:hypothetical protein